MLKRAVYTDVTKRAKSLFPDKYGDYHSIYICVDTENSWIIRILEGFNEEYERDKNSVLLERNDIDDYCGSDLPYYSHQEIIDDILEKDGLDNWDCLVVGSVEEAIEAVDDGFGIIKEN